jgi:lipopolysaccharide biosynthesis glycosyltransferase
MNNIGFNYGNKKKILTKLINFKKEVILLLLFLIYFSFNYFQIKKNHYLNYINVAYAFDNIYYYITHVSMKSLMLNQNNNTFIIFHILVSSEIFNEQKEITDRICQEHNNCKIIYHIIGNDLREFSVNGIIKRTTAIYYRLLLQNIIRNESKILYLDCDTLVYKDLTEIYNYNITDFYYVGQYEGKPINKYGSQLKDFINSGVMLINLDNLRKDKIFDKIICFLKKNNDSLYFLDQDAINVVCNKKNGIFPSNYISFGICDSISFENIIISKKKNNSLSYDPYIFHFKVYMKPWIGIPNNNKLICFDQIHRFYEYARKTSYYFEILDKFKVFN